MTMLEKVLRDERLLLFGTSLLFGSLWKQCEALRIRSVVKVLFLDNLGA